MFQLVQGLFHGHEATVGPLVKRVLLLHFAVKGHSLKGAHVFIVLYNSRFRRGLVVNAKFGVCFVSIRLDGGHIVRHIDLP